MIEKKQNNGVWKYYWTAGGMLKAVQRPDGSVITFKYDAFGRRISKKYLRREFLYIWDKNVPLHEIQKEELCEDNIITWIFEGFTPTAKLINDKAYSIISDHIGTPILAIDTQGNKVWERELDIYGRVRKEFTSDDVANRRCGFIPFLYAGQYYDKETELAYNRFRYYDPNTGSYISQDPIGLAGGNPTLYGYVFDSNVEIDIFGLSGRGGAVHQDIQKQLAKDLGDLGKNVRTEGRIKLKNGKSRFGDVVVYTDATETKIAEVHQIGDMRTRGGFKPSSRERGAIMDIREALGDDVKIVFHDKKQQVTLINPDKADDWKIPNKKHRKNSC